MQNVKKNKKKIILSVILLLAAIFVITQNAVLFVTMDFRQDENKRYTMEYALEHNLVDEKDVNPERETISIDTSKKNDISGDQQAVQEFYGKTGRLDSVFIRFFREDMNTADGDIHVQLYDQNEKLLAEDTKKVTKLKQTKFTDATEFELGADIKKGEIYKLVIQSVGVKNCHIYTAVSDSGSEKDQMSGTLTFNGETVEGYRVPITFTITYFGWKSLLFIMGVLILGLIFVWLEGELIQKLCDKVFRKRNIDINMWLAWLYLITVPVIGFFLIQRYADYGVGAFIRLLLSGRGIVNVGLIAVITLLIFVISGSGRIAAVITVLLCNIAGLANYFVMLFRGTPILFADLASLQTAANVASGYEYQLNLSCVWAICVSVSLCCMICALDVTAKVPVKVRIGLSVATVLSFVGVYQFFFVSDILEEHSVSVSAWNPTRNYFKNGSLLSFMITWTYRVIDKPSGYSIDTVEKLAELYPSDEVSEGKELPNVIAIMNEAFADLNVDEELQTSEDYMPFFHSLTENTVKGNLYVSVFGGNTANSEYEFLTGNTLLFYPFHSVPYSTYIKEPIPSLTKVLTAQGYSGNMAVHPYVRSGWNREFVYEMMGFTEFISQESFENPEYVRSFISDASDMDKIIELYEETRKTTQDPFYLFNVTVQNHSSYEPIQGVIDTPIKITNESQQDDAAEQYINLMKLSDDAFKELLDYFSNVEEDTLIVMFGDHQPSIGNSFYRSLFQKEIAALSIEENARRYITPYVIWANYDIEEEEKDMSANYLSSYLLHVMGADMSGYQKYLLDLQEKIPVITNICYIGTDGTVYDSGEESEYSELLNEYQILQYNNAFDKGNRVESFFTLKEE